MLHTSHWIKFVNVCATLIIRWHILRKFLALYISNPHPSILSYNNTLAYWVSGYLLILWNIAPHLSLCLYVHMCISANFKKTPTNTLLYGFSISSYMKHYKHYKEEPSHSALTSSISTISHIVSIIKQYSLKHC